MLRSWMLCCAMAGLAGCGDPLADFDRLSDLNLAPEARNQSAVPAADEVAREGFFGTSAARAAPEGAEGTAGAEGAGGGGGLLGLFRRGTSRADVAARQGDAPKQSARGGGLFGFGRASAPDPDAPDARDVPFGTTLAHGLVARVCEAQGKTLGMKVQEGPVRGVALYDSAPGSAQARTWYITGFADGCPRQLTAANVLLGATDRYETLRYGPAGQHLPRAATDSAYEALKKDVCGVKAGQPCGARAKRMARDTFFVSAYDSFGNSSRWSELLVHDGAVLAAAVKTSG